MAGQKYLYVSAKTPLLGIKNRGQTGKLHPSITFWIRMSFFNKQKKHKYIENWWKPMLRITPVVIYFSCFSVHINSVPSPLGAETVCTALSLRSITNQHHLLGNERLIWSIWDLNYGPGCSITQYSEIVCKHKNYNFVAEKECFHDKLLNRINNTLSPLSSDFYYWQGDGQTLEKGTPSHLL